MYDVIRWISRAAGDGTRRPEKTEGGGDKRLQGG